MKNGASTLSLVRGSPFESGSIEEGLPEVRRREAHEKGWRDSLSLCQSLAAVRIGYTSTRYTPARFRHRGADPRSAHD